MAKKPVTMDFKWNYSAGGIVQRLGFGTELNQFFAQTLLDAAEPYTPELTGALLDSATIESNPVNAKIVYPGIPYADYQYFGDDDWNRTKPGSTSGWLHYAWQVHKFQIAGKVGAHVRWHGK